MDEKGLVELLSNEAPMLGPVKAKQLVAAFGNQTLVTLRTSPGLILEKIGGLNLKAVEALSEWSKARQGDAVFRKELYGLGLTTGLINRILSHYKTNVMEQVRADCFALTKITGIGFTTAATVADKLGLPKDDPGRIRAGILYVLEDSCQQYGSTCLHHEMLIREACELLELGVALVSAQLVELQKSGEIAISFAGPNKDRHDCPIEHALNPELFKDEYPQQYETLMQERKKKEYESQQEENGERFSEPIEYGDSYEGPDQAIQEECAAGDLEAPQIISQALEEDQSTPRTEKRTEKVNVDIDALISKYEQEEVETDDEPEEKMWYE